MKVSFDYKRLHLRFIFGTGFVLFIIRKAVKRHNPDTAEAVASLGKQVKKMLKQHKRVNGSFNLVEIEDGDGTRIAIKI